MENNLPKGWIRCEISDVCKIQNGFAFPSNDFKKEDGIPIIKQTQLGEYFVELDKCLYVDKKFLNTKKEFIVSKGDVLFGMSGSIGKFCVYNFDFTTLLNQRVGKILLYNEKEISKRYIYYYLRSTINSLLKKGKGLGVLNISSKDIETEELIIPSFLEQNHIVNKLDALTQKIQIIKERLDTIPLILKHFRQSILYTAVSGKLTEDWRKINMNIESADKLIYKLYNRKLEVYEREFKKAAINGSRKPKIFRGIDKSYQFQILNDYDIPTSWEWTIIDKISNVALGGTPSRKISEYWNGNIFWVSSGEVANNIIIETKEKITIKGLENSNAKVYPKGTVLLAMIGEGKTRGQVSILDIDATTNQNVAGLILDNEFICSKYVWYFLMSRYENLRTGGLGGAQPALNAERVGQINICIPPIEEQKEIVRRVENLFKFADKIEARYKKAKDYIDKLPQTILAKAFRG